MSDRERIVVAMSGGIDSAVAAARLHDAGYEVVGITLHLWDYPEETDDASHGRCCAPEDQYDAKRTADQLGFAHYTFDRRELFRERVVQPFVEAYLTGDTPSPCTACNRGVKLTELFAIADRLGATRVATGHYARVVRRNDGPALAIGHDRSKDQSYFLYATTREQLARLVFPLGETTKAEVRREAVARKLPGATKGESQELCFVGAGAHAYADFVSAEAPNRIRPGPIVDGAGRVVGNHSGVHRFTVGQRKGVGVALGKPVFVTRIDPETATVHLGDGEALHAVGATLEDVALPLGGPSPSRAHVRVRYRHDGAPARLETTDGGGLRILFDEPVRAVTRGQVAVLYEGDTVLGGGRIALVTSTS